jgi:tripartite-type tricarboxylate transporter receptor subunit TctC
MLPSTRRWSGCVLLLALALAVGCAPAASPAQPTPAAAAKPATPAVAASPVAASPVAASPAAQGKPAPAPAPAATFDQQAVAAFYRGKTVKIVVGYAAGGGFDLYARLLARKLGAYIPGNPTVIVENMPGAGSLTAANYIARVAPKDGTEMATFIQTIVMAARVGGQGVEFDPLQLTWLGNPLPEPTVCAIRSELGITDLRQAGASGRVLQFGSAGANGNSFYMPNILQRAGVARFNIVAGYAGTSPLRLAMEQGELDGSCAVGWLLTQPEWFTGDQPFARLVVQTGKTRSKDLPNVPTWREFPVDPGLAPLLDAAEAVEEITRPYAMPPGVPADRAAAMRQAFMQAWQDPELQAEAERAKLPADARDHAFVEAAVDTIMRTPDSVLPQVKEFFGYN